MRRLLRASGVSLLAVALCLLAGCSRSLRENYQRDKAAGHVYQRTLSDLWPEVKAHLKKEGYSWKEMPGHYVLETEWRDAGGGTLGPTSSSRFLIEGHMLPNGGSILRVMRGNRVSQAIGGGNVEQRIAQGGSARAQEEQAVARANANTTGVLPTQQTYARDLELELELLRRIEPDAAGRLARQAALEYP
ncbi:hypothetical protein MFUL124B02_34125 [Myxococcus fulvus 124B02]|nr:hypothetical protein MFUL124B02_34125 [Myxococcus fulvus 124B02]